MYIYICIYIYMYIYIYVIICIYIYMYMWHVFGTNLGGVWAFRGVVSLEAETCCKCCKSRQSRYIAKCLLSRGSEGMFGIFSCYV